MGKKTRIKKSNQEKQGNHQDDNPRNTISARNLDVADLISSLHDDIIRQIIPILLRKRNQQKEHNPDNITRKTVDMDPNDFISRLPNNILYHIISLLPFESAFGTTFLSTHWKDLWKDVLLDSICDVTVNDAIATILSFVEDIANKQHQARKNWGFKFEFDHGKVLLAAFSPNSNSLWLDFSSGENELPIKPFDCLLKLNLESFSPQPSLLYDPSIDEQIIPEFNFPLYTQQSSFTNSRTLTFYDPFYTQQSSFNTMKVISLYLISVNYSSNEAISSMVSNFPFLKSLTIAKCHGLRSLKVKSARGIFRLVVLDCPHLEFLRVESCSLTSCQYRGRLVSFEFEVSCSADCLSFCSKSPYKRFLLNDAMLDFRQGPPIYYSFNCDGFKSSIVESIKSVKSLTLCRWVYESLISWMLPSLNREYSDSKFRFYQLKELWWIDCSMQKDNINVLLNFLKLCPNLERLYVTIDPKSYSLTSTKRFADKVNEVGKFYHLKLLWLEGFANEKKEIFFAKKLRPLFRTTPLIVAKYKGACLRRLVKVPELEKEGKCPFKFKEVKDLHQICPNHIHMKL